MAGTPAGLSAIAAFTEVPSFALNLMLVIGPGHGIAILLLPGSPILVLFGLPDHRILRRSTDSVLFSRLLKHRIASYTIKFISPNSCQR